MEERENKKISRRLQGARFRYQSSMEEIDLITPRGLDKTYLMRFADASFVKKGENIMITGTTEVGKSYIATALGHQACLFGYKTSYYSAQSFLPCSKCQRQTNRTSKKLKNWKNKICLLSTTLECNLWIKT
jgi:DNA replication protein DnaC